VVTKFNQNDHTVWDNEREGYLESRSKFVPVVEIPRPAKKQAAHEGWVSLRTEERVGSLLAAGGTVWLVYVATVDFNHMWQMSIMPPGPVEVCALGILLWLHAKWRRSIKN